MGVILETCATGFRAGRKPDEGYAISKGVSNIGVRWLIFNGSLFTILTVHLRAVHETGRNKPVNPLCLKMGPAVNLAVWHDPDSDGMGDGPSGGCSVVP